MCDLSNLPAIRIRLQYYSRLHGLLADLEDARPLRLAEAATRANMERTAFSKYFRQKAGISFHAFLERCRIAKAMRYIDTSDTSFAEIAYLTGFSNVCTFLRSFKRVSKLTPSEYRSLALSAPCQPRGTPETALVDALSADARQAEA